ncbi:MAG: hypothetical protein R3C05_11510 [Pirellulaceae bacterium]
MSPILESVTKQVRKRYPQDKRCILQGMLRGLTKAASTDLAKARSMGNGGQAFRLDDDMCRYLIARIVYDLKLESEFPEFPQPPCEFFTRSSSTELVIEGSDAKLLYERLVQANQDADTSFRLLEPTAKARLKYEKILSAQPVPILEQVGPRSLLQFGKLDTDSLVGLLFWRKWFYDIDNRAGQETGYLFEPILAHAVGGFLRPHPRAQSSGEVIQRRDAKSTASWMTKRTR